MSKDNGEPAFPVIMDSYVRAGITKREWFAGMIIQGLIASSNDNLFAVDGSHIAKLAYQLADNMIQEGKRK